MSVLRVGVGHEGGGKGDPMHPLLRHPVRLLATLALETTEEGEGVVVSSHRTDLSASVISFIKLQVLGSIHFVFTFMYFISFSSTAI